MKIKNKKKSLIIYLSITFLFIFVMLTFSKSVEIENVDTLNVNPDSELKYYLTVSYDGVDRNGLDSFDKKTISKIYSDYIYVEDIIPEGLEFIKFVETSEGNIGASFKEGFTPSSSEEVCRGAVFNDSNRTFEDDKEIVYYGLHYNKETRTVSFKVRNLQAGCQLTVGIVTKTPETIDDPTTDFIETRRDFYNTATAWEGKQSVISNLTHAWMGTSTTDYAVKYSYTGTVPLGAPNVPYEMRYAIGSQVGVASSPKIEGYKFTGWVAIGITGNSFTMPNHDVEFTGSFVKLDSYKVTYKIADDSPVPEGYIVPSEKQYYEDAIVKFDSMKAGDTFNGYKFLGWTINGADVSDSEFRMPAKDIEVVGRWEQIKYKVEFKFIGDVVPPEGDSLLPSPSEYVPGESVTIENIEDVEGFGFVGWNYDYEFIMPEHDVIIYGEWMIRNGVFAPEIKKEINNPKDYYFPGDIVNYTITVTNTADYPIKNVIVRDNNEKATLNYISICNQGVLSGLDKGEENINEEIKCNIESRSDHIAQINYIGANSSIKINASYLVTDEDFGIIPNEVEILGATADNNYVLDQEREYKSEVSFKVASQINICKKVNGKAIEKEFQFRITNEDESFESWMILNDGACDTIYVEPGDYKVEEIIPQEFILSASTRNKDGNEDSNYPNGELFVVDELSRYNFTFTNTYKKKGFLHSFGRVVNSILGSQDSLSLLG